MIAGLLGVILLGFLYNALRAGADPAGVAGGMVPSFAGVDSLLLATGILGATVMPHVIYLHSALTKTRSAAATGAGRSAAGRCATSASTRSSRWASPGWSTWPCC